MVERDGESVKPQQCRAHSMYYNVGGITRLYERDPIFEKSTAHDISFDTIFSLFQVKFIYSEKATKFCEISTLLLSYVVPVTSKVEISQNFEVFSEYMNFTPCLQVLLGLAR
jgi:hypothetical protein